MRCLKRARGAMQTDLLTCSGRLGGAAAGGRRRQFLLAELLLADSGADAGARAIGADADRLRLVGAAAMVPAPIERSQLRGHRQQIGKSAALTVGRFPALSALRRCGSKDQRNLAALPLAAVTRAREAAPIPARSDADRPAPAGWAALRLLADVDSSF